LLESISALNISQFLKRTREELHQNNNLETRACGEAPITVAMVTAKMLGAMRGVTISYSNSGETLLGEEARVVGYGAEMITTAKREPSIETEKPQALAEMTEPGSLTFHDKKMLLELSRETLDRYFTTETLPLPRNFSQAASVPRGVFVTLRKDGNLRGCIGRMTSNLPLYQGVGKITLQSAFEDARFPPLQYQEMNTLQIEISVLTPFRSVDKSTEIQVGRDGVYLRKGAASAVFLPQVAIEQGWDRETLLGNLCLKAGLNSTCWRQNAELYIFQADIFQEEEILKKAPAKEPT
ncbi:MAG: AmmeMemoRadiSam system protein A, partial [Syntrophales bacterium LBB04]|nr:AmmeMemoRadiSam system protein A [Syntrophales bacterium LBB04]